MDRIYLAQYVLAQFSPLLAAANLATVSDNISGFGPALDSVMRQLGLPTRDVDKNPTLVSGTEQDAVLLTRYFVLDMLSLFLAGMVDTTTGNQKKIKSQWFNQVQILLKTAKAQIPVVYNLEAGDFTFGRIQLDILEPWYSGSAVPPALP